ncbi:tumor necrosis factor receptor superfamily member 14-like isoform X2 [Labeo rohita]|uniref:tumor necrosis factor receptor superfamily member 14-like isoform X2 n=1 Tax=Labeo rohita TaxID=84645 RepID=UPI0021E2F49B|nr:tumor necrosis factor receptor superfamily member 14-like isoform X2 [Labeo rohita]
MEEFLQAIRHENDVVFLIFVLCTLPPFGKACGQSEYESAVGECCPMCNIGSIVRSDCSGDLSTTCKPCAPGTFISQGLYIQHKCSTIQDTVCDVIDGYYCIDYSNSQCSHAQKHSVCIPGQETKIPGTKTSDTVCVDCPRGFYSQSGLNCTKWTDCSARNKIETEHGSSVKDVTCSPKGRERYGFIFAVVLAAAFYIILCCAPLSTSCKLKHPVEETNPTKTAQPNHNTPEDHREGQVVSQESVTPSGGSLADHL